MKRSIGKGRSKLGHFNVTGSRTLALLLLSLLLCQGCARSVRVEHTDISTSQDSLDIFNTRVEVQAPPPAQLEAQESAGCLLTGIYNNWKIDFASQLPQAVAEAISHTFSEVNVHNSYRKSCDNCGIIVRPVVTDFKVNQLTLQATIELETRIYDAYNNPITTFKHEGSSPILSATRLGAAAVSFVVPLGGSAIGNPVMRSTVKSALNKSLQNVKTRFGDETHAGGELARVWRPKKSTYGEHEYVAEQTARRLGCNMRTDGVSLSSTKYGKETYNAYCWELGTFTIDCELGRCTANLAAPIASSENEPSGGLN